MLKYIGFACVILLLAFTISITDSDQGGFVGNNSVKEDKKKESFKSNLMQEDERKEIHFSNSITSYIDKCIGISNQESENEIESRYIANSLMESQYREFISSLFFYRPNGRKKVDFLHDYILSENSDDLASVELIKVCSNNPELENCGSELFNEVRIYDSTDGEIWSYITNFNAGRSDKEETLISMNRVLSANYYGSSFAERVKRISYEFDQQTDGDLYDGVIEALRLEAISAPSYLPLFNFCEKHANDTYISSMCFRVGSDFAARGKTSLLNITGISLMRMMINKGYPESNSSELTQYEKHLNSGNEINFQRVTDLMKYNNELLLYWLNNLSKFNEGVAKKMVIDEVEKLAQNEDFTNCKTKIQN